MATMRIKILAPLCAAVALAACGGGGGSGSGRDIGGGTSAAPTSGVPASAQQSVAGLVAFLGALIADTSETAEPILLGDAVLPTTEVDAPTALN